MSSVSAGARDWCRERLDDPAEELALAVLFAVPRLREALTAAAALYVELERIATRFRDLNVARTKLGWWRDELGRLDAGQAAHPAIRLLAASGVTPPLAALGDLLTGFELILLEGRVSDLATARLRAELGYARFAPVLAQLYAYDNDPLVVQTGVALGLARLLRSPALAGDTRTEIARAARGELRARAPQFRMLPPPLRVLAALAWRSVGGVAQGPSSWLERRARVFTAWRAARGRPPRTFGRA